MAFVNVPRPPRRPSRFWPIVAASLGGLIIFLAFTGLITGVYALLFSGRIFPGISMAGVDLSSMTPEQATKVLQQRLVYPLTGRIVLRYGEQVWVETPAQLGMVFDVGKSVQRAYDIGRRGGPLKSLANQLNAWQGGLELYPVILLDEKVAYRNLQNIAARIDQPVVEADLSINGTQVVYRPGQVGRSLNVDKTLEFLLARLKTFQDGEVQLIVEEENPLILDASAQAKVLQQALSSPLTLSIAQAQPDDPAPWVVDTPVLANMLSAERVQTDAGWQFKISMDTSAIEQYLNDTSPLINRSSQNARFYFDDPTGQLVLVQPSKTGRTLDINGTLDAIQKGLLQGQHNIPLVITLDKPAVPDDATAASLGITGLVKSYTSYFRGSGPERLQNIQAASARFYGLLVPPNTTFSMGDAIGDISLDNGYAEALIIYNGRSIRGVGGGVCQVSTTLFRTALYGGYPIVERHEHAYRVFYYEQTARGSDPDLAGLDATVYFPLVDLKFTNDRPSWLLMETYFDPVNDSLTWKFYSGDDGRTTDVENHGLQNVVPAPDPLFVEDPDLGPNQMKQVDWPADGANILVTRTVTRGGQVIISDSFHTVYEPWQAVCNYGSGTEDPKALADELGLCR